MLIYIYIYVIAYCLLIAYVGAKSLDALHSLHGLGAKDQEL